MLENDNEHFAVLLDELYKEERAGTLEDIALDMYHEIKKERLFQLLTRDKRFIWLGNRKKPESLQFVSRQTIYQTLLGLNKRANLISLKLINVEQFIGAISKVFLFPLSRKDKKTILEWAKDILLVPSISSEHIFFNAPDLVCWMNENIKGGLWSVLEDILSYNVKTEELEHRIEILLGNFFGDLSHKISQKQLDMTLLRLGLMDGHRHTLKEVGSNLGLTRERARQLEMKFKDIVKANTNKDDSLLRALYLMLLKHRGRRIYSTLDGIDFFRIQLISETYNLPFNELYRIKAYLLGVNHKLARDINKVIRKPLHFISSNISNLRGMKGLFLCPDDWVWLDSTCTIKARKSLKCADVIYFVMKKLGKPVSYQQIAEQYNLIFPERKVTPTGVLSTLNRNTSGQRQKSPWVWTGTRGIYALREWGFERPRKSLFDTIFEIVKEKYDKIGKPVSLATIYAEIGKHRKLVNKRSIDITVQAHPKLASVGSNKCVPITSIDDKNKYLKKEEDSLNELAELDRALRNLED